MGIIQLDGTNYPISEVVGDYIDGLVELKNTHLRRFEAINRMAQTWLDSDCNTIDKAKERIGFSCILGITQECLPES